MIGRTSAEQLPRHLTSPHKGNASMPDRKYKSEGEASPAVTVSIIIATYNARELLADCLQSIRQNPPSEPYELIVVDDASRDGTSEMVQNRFPEVRLFANETNRNYSPSNNLALEHARGRYIYLLNNDTIVLPHAIDRMLAFLREHPDAGAVGSKLLNEDGTIQWSVKSLPSLGSAIFGARSIITRIFPDNPFSRKHLLHLDRDLTKPFIADAGYVSGASVMMPHEVVKTVGYLDETFFYHVDADYSKRISDAGYNNYYLPTATVIHLNHKGGSMVNLRKRFRSVLGFHRGSYNYYRKHMERTAGAPYRIIVVVGLLFRLLVSLMIQTLSELIHFVISLGARTMNGLRRPSAGRTVDR
jgi:N-acetylglucosaminyl-diphospho-decaprenol L-rhamnosyltransferase